MSDNGNDKGDDFTVVVLAETENFAVLQAEDLDGELVYNIELGNITVHFYQEEWDELVKLVREATA